ncbi:MAG: SPOR domain-containing protein [Bacteroidales bacterium]|nr:SPOR domain-containing protein [Bacteroidales bacterium]
MKDLSPFIRELLFSHDCVILPGLGGFIGNYKPAGIDRESHTFTPPLKAISFNSNLDNNDGLLIGGISARKGIAYAAARRMVEDYVSGLRAALSKGERVHMPGIGHLRLNDEGSLLFEPDKDINFLLDSYGLEPFIREPVKDYALSGLAAARRHRDPVALASRRRMIWRAAVAIPFILAMVIVPLKTDLFRSDVSLNPLAKIEFEESRQAHNAASGTMTQADNADAAKAKVEDAAATEPAEKEETASTVTEAGQKKDSTEMSVDAGTRGAGVWYLVVGSFRDSDNAEHMLRDLAGKGYDAELIKSGNGYLRVAATSFGTKQEAIDERTRLEDSFDGIWLWKK